MHPQDGPAIAQWIESAVDGYRKYVANPGSSSQKIAERKEAYNALKALRSEDFKPLRPFDKPRSPLMHAHSFIKASQQLVAVAASSTINEYVFSISFQTSIALCSCRFQHSVVLLQQDISLHQIHLSVTNRHHGALQNLKLLSALILPMQSKLKSTMLRSWTYYHNSATLMQY